MTTYYKAVRPNGRDFYTGQVQWAPENTKARKGRVVKHPTSTLARPGHFETFLSVSTDVTDLPGASWPLRLLEVEPVDDIITVSERKRGGTAFRVVAEVAPHLRFGPMGEHVAALIGRAATLTVPEVRALAAARYAAGHAADAAWDAARYAAGHAADAAWDAARYAARHAADAAWDAARHAADAAAALVIRDIIHRHGYTQEHYDSLTGPWRTVIGPIHPDDAELT